MLPVCSGAQKRKKCPNKYQFPLLVEDQGYICGDIFAGGMTSCSVTTYEDPLQLPKMT